LLNEGEIKNVALYTRVSTREQATKGFSIEAQEEKLRKFCDLKEWEVYDTYSDKGYSGRNIKRPEYQEMFQNLKNFDAIICFKMDRIHRRVKNALKMFEDLEKLNIFFVSWNENIDTSTAIGRAMMIITMVFAQLESEQTGERVVIGMEQKHKDKSSNHILHRMPMGYIIDKKDPENHKIIPLPNELDMVKQIYEMYEQGMSCSQIAKKLGNNIKTGKPWHRSSIENKLKNPAYCGFLRSDNAFIECLDPIISREYYNKIQKMIVERIDNPALRKKVKPLEIPLEGDYFELSEAQANKLTYRLRPQRRAKF